MYFSLLKGMSAFIWVGDNSKWNLADAFEHVHTVILLSWNQAEISLRERYLAGGKSDF